MLEFSFRITVNAAPEEIWPYYSQLENWYLWEEDLEDISLAEDSEFVTGSKGTMKLAGQLEMDFTLSSVIENVEFWDVTTIPHLGAIYFGHEINSENEKTTIKHSVRLEKADGIETKEDIDFLNQIFSDVPNSMYLIKGQVEK